MAEDNPRSPVANGVLIALAVIGILIGLWLLQRLQAVVVLVLISMVLAAGIDPLVERIRQLRLSKGRQIPRGLAILMVLFASILVFAGIIFYIGSVAWIEGRNLWEQIPELAAGLREWAANLSAQYPQIPPMEDLIAQARQQIGQIGQYAIQTTAAVFGVLGGLVSALSILVLVFYMSLEKESIKNTFFAFIPPEKRPLVGSAITEAFTMMGGWLRGQLLLGLIVIVVISIAMWILGMPYPLLLGLIGGIAELVPLLGPIVAALIAVPISLATQPVWMTIVLVVFFLVFAQVEGNWLVPRIMESQVKLSPLLTIIALFAGASLLGFVGALLAIPIAAALRIIVVRLIIPEVQKSNQKTVNAPEHPEKIE